MYGQAWTVSRHGADVDFIDDQGAGAEPKSCAQVGFPRLHRRFSFPAA